jgi:hypothetical protein
MVANNLETLIQCKEDMKAAIEERGVTITGGLSTYADLILDIDADLNLNSTGWDETTIGYAIESLQNRINWTVDYVNERISNSTSGVQLFGFDDYKPYNTALTFFPANVDISKYNDISYFFKNQDGLIFIGDINTHNAENVHYMFYNCSSLISTPDLDFTNVINANGVFNDCSSLERIGNISNFGIQPNFKSFGLFMYCYNLEPESVVNFFNNLYDRASVGYSVVELGFQRECLNKLSENDLMIAINKGYSIVGYV